MGIISIALSIIFFMFYDINKSDLVLAVVSAIASLSMFLSLFQQKYKNMLYGFGSILILFFAFWISDYHVNHLLITVILFVIFCIIQYLIYSLKRIKNKKWYDSLNILEKENINSITLKIKKSNSNTFKYMPKDYFLAKLLYMVKVNIKEDEEILYFSKYFINKYTLRYAQKNIRLYIYN